MTREEARELLQTTPIDIRSPRDDLSPADYFKALNMAIEALEKQIPKKPTGVDDEYSIFTCTECGTVICYVDDKETHKYCLSCGHAIDWSDEDD